MGLSRVADGKSAANVPSTRQRRRQMSSAATIRRGKTLVAAFRYVTRRCIVHLHRGSDLSWCALVRASASRRLSRVVLAIRVGLWLFGLPLRWRAQSLTALLERITPPPRRRRLLASNLDETLQVVVRVSRFAVFEFPGFPRVCVREALALYRELRRMGHPARFCVGVRKDGGALIAHSWVSLHGVALMPWSAESSFSILYVFPPERSTNPFPASRPDSMSVARHS